MPLILLCGYPCSGKTTIANLIAESLLALKPEHKVVVISEEEIAKRQMEFANEEPTRDPRVSIYSNASSEKQFRAQIKAETERAMTGSKSAELVVIVDANNYIKGYRYEMHCLAKSLRHQQAIIHCTTLLDTCQYLNNKIDRYPDSLFSSLVSRFEPPNASTRWDSPLYQVTLPSNMDLESTDLQPALLGLVTETATRIVKELLSSSTKVRPNQSTIPIQAASANYLQILDQATTRVIDNILQAQINKSDFSLPSDPSDQLQLAGFEMTAVTLNKAKRRFLAFVRANARSEPSERRTTESEAESLFLRFLNSETHQSAFLT